MSRAGARADRAPMDYYGTPGPLATAICDYLARRGMQPNMVIEPSAGHGAFVNAARERWPSTNIVAVELDKEKLPALLGANTLVQGDWVQMAWQIQKNSGQVLILGNPPYTDAESHIYAALDTMARGDDLVFLLRINFLGSHDRVRLWTTPGLRYLMPVIPRPSFTGDGKTDGTEYAVFWWEKGFTGEPTVLPPLVWRAKGARS